jgi:hypothetical protein
VSRSAGLLEAKTQIAHEDLIEDAEVTCVNEEQTCKVHVHGISFVISSSVKSQI